MTTGLFLSYSTRDRDDLENLLSALRRAGETVWFDEELGGGEVWWQKILERIRGCDVFVFALSDNSLRSKPCLAELKYAQALGKPVLPILIGPVASMRVSPLASVEAIDFQNPTADTGIRLITAMQGARRQSAALPSPLPDEPPVPFAYLMRAATAVDGAQLDPGQQDRLLADLRSAAEDDADAATRRDIAELLHRLSALPDLTAETRTGVTDLIARVEESSPQPAAKPKGSAKKWLAIAAAAAVAVVAVGVSMMVTRHRPAPVAAPATSVSVSPEGLDALLLSDTTVTTIMGAAKMQGDPPDGSMYTPTSTLSDPDCMGADYAAAEPVYAGTGWSAVSNQVLSQPRPDNPDSPLFWVNQAAISFPTDRQARDFLDKSTTRWKDCSGRVVKDDDETTPAPWSFGDMTQNKSVISQLSFQEGAGGWACQHALASESNAVLEAVACGEHVRDQAAQIVEKMLANVKS
ncbi:MAG: sensor domain-containing protein [Mycobacterium sp.]